MKAVHTIPIVMLAVAGSAAYVVFRPSVPSKPDPQPVARPVQVEEPAATVMPAAAPAPAEVTVEEQPVQPLEERNDAMLFEIDALGALPFDQSITMPFD